MVGRFFSRFRQPKVRFDVEVVEGDLYPGSTVEIRTVLQPSEQFVVREAVISLVCTEVSWKLSLTPTDFEYYVVDPEDRRLVNVRRETTELARLMETLLEPTAVIVGTEYRKDIRFTLPDDSPFTVQGDVADISWRLHAYVVPEKMVQFDRVQDVRVLSSPVSYEERTAAQPLNLEANYDSCKLMLDVSSRTANIGGALTGTFRVRCNHEIRLYWLVADLECTERTGDKSKSPKDLRRVIFEKDMQFQANEVKEWPFEIRIPNKALPSTSQFDTEVSWILRAGGEPRFRTGLSVSTPIQILGALSQ